MIKQKRSNKKITMAEEQGSGEEDTVVTDQLTIQGEVTKLWTMVCDRVIKSDDWVFTAKSWPRCVPSRLRCNLPLHQGPLTSAQTMFPLAAWIGAFQVHPPVLRSTLRKPVILQWIEARHVTPYDPVPTGGAIPQHSSIAMLPYRPRYSVLSIWSLLLELWNRLSVEFHLVFQVLSQFVFGVIFRVIWFCIEVPWYHRKPFVC